MLSSIIETLVLVCSSCVGFGTLQHQQNLANKTCQVLAAPTVSLTRCQHFMLSSIIETLVLLCSSCVGFCTLQHQQTLANKTCQVLAATIVSLTRCQHFMLSSIIETLVFVCSSCEGFVNYETGNPLKQNMLSACSPYRQSEKVSAFHAQFYH